MKKQVFNPYLPSWEYIPDGEPYVFDGRLYVYGSHDRFNGTQFCMNDYVCWSADIDDLSDWRFEGTIYRKEQDPLLDGFNIMQAPDVCKGPDGRYYLYYTLGLVPVMSVAVCDTPAGQYEYYGMVRYADGTPVGKRESHDLFQFDPGIFRDDDGRIWLYSGFGFCAYGKHKQFGDLYKLDGAYVMELEPDMITLRSEPKKIMAAEGEHGFYEASSMRKINGTYYFIYSSQLSHELCYAVGDRPDSEFTYEGTLISIGDVGLNGNRTPRNYLGNTHGSLVNIHDIWYIFYHRQTNRQQFSRQACAERIYMDENGRFRQAEITSCGLNDAPLDGDGLYEARIACNLWSKEGTVFYGTQETPGAEDHPYFTQTGQDREENGDQYISNMKDGATAGFKYFDFHGTKSVQIAVSGSGDGKVSIAVKPGGRSVCEIPVSLSGDINWFGANAEIPDGKHALYFTYHGQGQMDFHAFRLECQADRHREEIC